MMTAEQEAVLRSIKKLLQFWQISPEELGLEESPPIVRKVAPPPPPAGPKYKHPHTGETWDGQGSQPAWIREALTRGGFTVEELRLPGASTAASAPSEQVS